MFKKFMTAAAVSAVAVGAGAAAAAPAMAIGNDNGISTVNGNGAVQAYGNQKTHGDQSPQLGLVQGTLNKPCIGL
ncbi:rodlin, partial [Streptomyces sp. NPDC004314]